MLMEKQKDKLTSMETVWLLIFFQISENRLNGFKNGKTQLFNSGGVVK